MDVVTGGRKCPINSNKHNLHLVMKKASAEFLRHRKQW
jgi:hypothetical protein